MAVALQGSLFASGDAGVLDDAVFERTDLDHTSWVEIARGFYGGADDLFAELVTSVPWVQGRRWMYDREIDDPRLSYWNRSRPQEIHPDLQVIRRAIEHHYQRDLGGAGLNYYRDGTDSVAPHRDRELRHLDDTLVAIVTLGARRAFHIRPLGGGPSIDLRPGSGDLVVMGGTCQQRWEHAVPKTSRPVGPRISASWRWSSQNGGADPNPEGYFTSRTWTRRDEHSQ